MVTTIQIEEKMRRALEGMKLHPRETYNDVLDRMLEDLSELNEETKKQLEQALADYKAGRCKTHAQLKKEMGF
jgi:hypothetical protein